MNYYFFLKKKKALNLQRYYTIRLDQMEVYTCTNHLGRENYNDKV